MGGALVGPETVGTGAAERRGSLRAQRGAYLFSLCQPGKGPPSPVGSKSPSTTSPNAATLAITLNPGFSSSSFQKSDASAAICHHVKTEQDLKRLRDLVQAEVLALRAGVAAPSRECFGVGGGLHSRQASLPSDSDSESSNSGPKRIKLSSHDTLYWFSKLETPEVCLHIFVALLIFIDPSAPHLTLVIVDFACENHSFGSVSGCICQREFDPLFALFHKVRAVDIIFDAV